MSSSDSGYKLQEDDALLKALRENPSLKIYAGNFLLYGGILTGHSDGELDENEAAYLAEALEPIMEDPRALIDGLDSPDAAVRTLKITVEWLNEHGSEIKHDLFRCLCGIVAADGTLDQNENRFVTGLAARMNIPSQVARDILERAFSKDEEALL